MKNLTLIIILIGLLLTSVLVGLLLFRYEPMRTTEMGVVRYDRWTGKIDLKLSPEWEARKRIAPTWVQKGTGEWEPEPE